MVGARPITPVSPCQRGGRGAPGSLRSPVCACTYLLAINVGVRERVPVRGAHLMPLRQKHAVHLSALLFSTLSREAHTRMQAPYTHVHTSTH